MAVVHVSAQIETDKHAKLVELARDRGIPLNSFVTRLLEWAGEQDVSSLVSLGVRIPVYPGELEPKDSAVK